MNHLYGPQGRYFTHGLSVPCFHCHTRFIFAHSDSVFMCQKCVDAGMPLPGVKTFTEIGDEMDAQLDKL